MITSTARQLAALVVALACVAWVLPILSPPDAFTRPLPRAAGAMDLSDKAR